MFKYLFFCISLSLMAAGVPRAVFAEVGHPAAGQSQIQNRGADDCDCCDKGDQNAASVCRSCCAITVTSYVFPANDADHADSYADRVLRVMVGKSESPEPPPPRT
jgi:hypothetical protein